MSKQAFTTHEERKITVLDTGLTKVLKIENFLPEKEYQEVKEECRNLLLFTTETDFRGRDYSRVYLDDFYENSRNTSKILTHMGKGLFEEKALAVYRSIPETAFKTLPMTTAHETQLTVYRDGAKYNWHTDETHGRMGNYVLMIDLRM